MAKQDLTGINNVGEFYSAHYLESLLESDMKALFGRWKEQEEESGTKSPDRLLEACARAFFDAKADALRAPAGEKGQYERLRCAQEFHAVLLQALGYAYAPTFEPIQEKSGIPVVAKIERDGHPHLWVLENRFGEDNEDWLDQILLKSPRQQTHDLDMPKDLTLADLPALVFRQEQPPRWVLLLAGRVAMLIDRTKWSEGRYLSFDLDELFGRRERFTLKVAAALLAKETLCADGTQLLHDALDENSHKHAFAVSTELKVAVRQAVELLANEYVYYQRTTGHQVLFADRKLADKLRRECMIYLYRLLFLFYVESRADLGVVPMNSDEYRLGYSIEALRDLELVHLQSDKAKNGFFFHESLDRLFHIINEGYPEHLGQTTIGLLAHSILNLGFEIHGLQSDLFDRKQTPLLSSSKFRNAVLQQVIRLLSISKEGAKTRGRISYAQLGINQLGAVYEGLLSYTGFFATEPLYEVKRADENDPGAQTYFIPESEAERFREDEFVRERDDNGEWRRKRYEKGRFIFHLAGRDRARSASYYTPEVLAQCLVKYTLKDLIETKSADELLTLTVCEPAMGSGAFLNEAINQLAAAYLDKKQAETGTTIPPEQYRLELQRVKAHFAMNNVYGVDLNPIAVELAKVSLWLNILHPDAQTPWFGLRFANGNSLIGGRREVFNVKDITRKNSKADPNWLGVVPHKVPFGEQRPKGTVYHFLLPDQGMVPFDGDKVIKDLRPDETAHIKEWRKTFCEPFKPEEAAILEQLSDAVDTLYNKHKDQYQRLFAATRQPIDLWPHDRNVERSKLLLAERDALIQELANPTSAHSRLKLVMDYWCALWFWPIEKAKDLPTRKQWLDDLKAILLEPQDMETVLGGVQAALPNLLPEQQPLATNSVYVDVDQLKGERSRLQTAATVADEQRFHHWPLAFPLISGFDVVLGNPPWVKVDWVEADLLADFDPMINLRDYSAQQVQQQRKPLLDASDVNTSLFVTSFAAVSGAKAFLSATQQHGDLYQSVVNLYKSFLIKAGELLSSFGFSGLIHPASVFEEGVSSLLRQSLLPRIDTLIHFNNAINLFPEIHHRIKYSFTISRGSPHSKIAFDYICNVIHPSTVDASFTHPGIGPAPGIKDADGNWDLRGHCKRIIRADETLLDLSRRLFNLDCDRLEAPLMAVHSEELLNAFRAIADCGETIGEYGKDYYTSECWHETGAQKDGSIRKETKQVEKIAEWVMSGPHFSVATPLNKTPRVICRHNQDYDEIDLTEAPNDYLPRTNYVPNLTLGDYRAKMPAWNGQPVADYYRHVHREMVNPNNERTLIGCIIPPGPAHVHTVFSVAFADYRRLLVFSGLCASLPFDFIVKAKGATHVNQAMTASLPYTSDPVIGKLVAARALRLNALTKYYADLWKAQHEVVVGDSHTSDDYRLRSWSGLPKEWQRDCALRTDFERRQVLVELDALGALALGLSADELITIYRVQFPVLQGYEAAKRFDQNGRQVPNAILKLADKQGLKVTEPGTIADPDKPERLYVMPFTPVDREAEMRQAYETFKARIEIERAKGGVTSEASV